MAESPEFYVSVLCDVFRPAASTIEDEEKDVSEGRRARARAGYEILSSFATLPGSSEQEVDKEALDSWAREVRRLSAAADRAKIGDQYLGRLLAHAPDDPEDQGWPHRHVRALIEDSHSGEVERGIMIERFNMRGVYGKELYEGGKQERELAAKYRGWSVTARPWPRTSEMLERIAKGWDEYAQDEDVRANQDLMRD